MSRQSGSIAAAGSAPRVVVDTNVYISALNFGGRADDVLALARAGVIEVYISPPIIDEIAGVLARKFGWSASRIREAMRAINDFTVLIHPTERVSLVREDEADNRILECAVAAAAETIVTGDRHLLKLQRFRAIRITTPGELLDPEANR